MNIRILRLEMILLIGIISTGFMDLFSLLLYFVANTLPVEWSEIGKLFINTYNHLPWETIHMSYAHANEIGWVIHYITGIAYAGIYFIIFHRILKYPIFSYHVFYFPMLLVVIPFTIIAPMEGYPIFFYGVENNSSKISYTILEHMYYTFGLIVTTYFLNMWNDKTQSHL